MSTPQFTLPPISDEERQLIERAREYERMKELPAWKMLLDYLALCEDRALGLVRRNMSTDPAMMVNLVTRWRVFGDVLQEVQNEVLGTIEQRNSWAKEFFVENNLDPQQLEQFIQMEEMQRG